MVRRVLPMLLLLAGQALAQPFPDHPIQVINPYGAGSTTDLLTRALTTAMQPRLGQPVVVVNRDGAAGGLGTSVAARAAADGYTLLFAPAVVLSVLPVVRPDIGYRAESFTPVCQAFENTMVLAVRTDSPLRSLADLVAAARSRPGALTYGHQGIASVPHLAAVAFQQAAGVELQDVPYRSEPSVVLEVQAGRVDFAALVAGSINNQPLRALAIFAPHRHHLLPDAPTAKEQGYDLSPASFGGLYAPVGTPAPVVARLAEACAAAAADPGYAEAARRSFQPAEFHLGPQPFAARMQAEIADKARLLAGLRLER
jgi:tripartite-type tricarboxylate transporter receptor subunit TctC